MNNPIQYTPSTHHHRHMHINSVKIKIQQKKWEEKEWKEGYVPFRGALWFFPFSMWAWKVFKGFLGTKLWPMVSKRRSRRRVLREEVAGAIRACEDWEAEGFNGRGKCRNFWNQKPKHQNQKPETKTQKPETKTQNQKPTSEPKPYFLNCKLHLFSLF